MLEIIRSILICCRQEHHIICSRALAFSQPFVHNMNFRSAKYIYNPLHPQLQEHIHVGLGYISTTHESLSFMYSICIWEREWQWKLLLRWRSREELIWGAIADQGTIYVIVVICSRRAFEISKSDSAGYNFKYQMNLPLMPTIMVFSA